MIQIKNNVVLVSGFSRSAIYDLNKGIVYSIDKDAENIINRYISDKIDDIFLRQLSEQGLFDYESSFDEYIPQCYNDSLDLVWLEITQACNMRCVHCYEGQTHISNKDVLSLSEWKQIIDEIAEIGVNRVVVIGGEPCIHKNIIDILEYLSYKNISSTIFSNGYFFNHNLIQTIIKCKVSVKLSLYGHNSIVHDGITKVPGSFNKLIDTIKTLLENNVNVNVAITIMKENEEYIEQIKNFLAEIGIKQFKFDVIREVVGGSQNVHIPTIKEVVAKAFRHKPNFKISKDKFDKNIMYNSCWYGKMVITENGDVLPCVFSRNLVAGNIKNMSIKEVRNKIKEKYWNIPLCKIDDCSICEYKYACKDCRSIADAAGNIFGKNPRCKYNPLKGEWEND